MAIRAPGLRPDHYRGTNYMPATTMILSRSLGWLDHSTYPWGFFSLSQVEDEIRAISANGLNCIRLHGSFYAWVIHRAKYLATLRSIASLCSKYNIRITYQIWEARQELLPDYGRLLNPNALGSKLPCPTDQLWAELPAPGRQQHIYKLFLDSIFIMNHYYARHYRLSLPPREPGQMIRYADPGNDLFGPDEACVVGMGPDYRRWPYGIRALIDSYLLDLGQFFFSDTTATAFGSFDLFNEPDTIPTGQQAAWMFIGDTYRVLLAIWQRLGGRGGFECTVGFGGLETGRTRVFEALRDQYGVHQAYISGHIYPSRLSVETGQFDKDLRAGKAYAERQGVPYVVSEINAIKWTKDYAFLSPMLRAMSDAGVGGQIWGFLRSNFFISDDIQKPGSYTIWDGVLIPWVNTYWDFSESVKFAVADTGALGAVRAWATSRPAAWV